VIVEKKERPVLTGRGGVTAKEEQLSDPKGEKKKTKLGNFRLDRGKGCVTKMVTQRRKAGKELTPPGFRKRERGGGGGQPKYSEHSNRA